MKQRFEHRIFDEIDYRNVQSEVYRLEQEGSELVALTVAHHHQLQREYYVVAMKRPVLD